MRCFARCFAVAGALFAVSALNPAQAAVCLVAGCVEIGLQENGFNGDAIVLQPGSPNPGGAAFVGTYGTFSINLITGTTTPAPVNQYDSATSLNTSTSDAGTLNVYVGVYNLSSPAYLAGVLTNFTSTFVGSLITTLLTVTESTSYDNTNNPLSWGGTLLATSGAHAGSGPPANGNFASAFNTVAATADPFAVFIRFEITADAGGGNTALDASLTGVRQGRDQGVPGPIAGAGVPGLMLACGALLAWYRQRRRRQLAA